MAGLRPDKKLLLAAFGRLTADGTRYNGLKRPDGRPLIQVTTTPFFLAMLEMFEPSEAPTNLATIILAPRVADRSRLPV